MKEHFLFFVTVKDNFSANNLKNHWKNVSNWIFEILFFLLMWAMFIEILISFNSKPLLKTGSVQVNLFQKLTTSAENVLYQNCSECQICVHNMFCSYSELTIFMNNEQSVVILWVG